MPDDSSRPRRPPGVPRTLNADEHPGLAAKVLERAKAAFRPVLVVLTGNQIGKRVIVDRSLLIGRDPAADLALTDALVSWHHARIEDRGDGWAVVDLGSTNGTTINGEVNPEALLHPDDRIVFGGTAVSFELQDGLKLAFNENVEQLLNIDDLSGLYVRRKFDAEVAHLVERARAEGRRLAMLVMDMDGIKAINDTHGHLFGAYTIGEAGRLVHRLIAGRGIGCRFGGDEYIAALPGLDMAEAEAVATDILRAVNEHPFVKDGIRLTPGISIGVAAFPDHAADAVSLFRAADAALYRAKQGGKNRVCR